MLPQCSFFLNFVLLLLALKHGDKLPVVNVLLSNRSLWVRLGVDLSVLSQHVLNLCIVSSKLPCHNLPEHHLSNLPCLFMVKHVKG